MASTIFYSWQSDSPESTNRSFIRKALNAAVEQIASDSIVLDSPRVDSGMEGISGTPEVATIMFNKIDKCAIFVGDVTLVGSVTSQTDPTQSKRIANPNVLLEMGYAAARLGWDRVICVMNEHYGERDEQAFDVRNRRFPIDYCLDPSDKTTVDKQMKALTKWLKIAILTAYEAEHRKVDDLIETLDAECISMMQQFGRNDYFHIPANAKVGIGAAWISWERPTERLLELRLLRYDFQKSSEGIQWAYHWTYFGTMVLQKLGLALAQPSATDKGQE